MNAIHYFGFKSTARRKRVCILVLAVAASIVLCFVFSPYSSNVIGNARIHQIARSQAGLLPHEEAATCVALLGLSSYEDKFGPGEIYSLQSPDETRWIVFVQRDGGGFRYASLEVAVGRSWLRSPAARVDVDGLSRQIILFDIDEELLDYLDQLSGINGLTLTSDIPKSRGTGRGRLAEIGDEHGLDVSSGSPAYIISNSGVVSSLDFTN
ncbi:MAG: hypothetical protein AAGD32_03365 [Planctomycetota bacterium]